MRVRRLAKIMALSGSAALAAGGAYRLSRYAPLPRYELRLEGGRAASLDSQGLQTLDPDSRLAITLRPELPVTHRVFVSVVVAEQSRQRAWPVLFERTPQGGLLLQGPLRELGLPCRKHCALTLYVSDFPLFPALFWLMPQVCRRSLLPRTQVLQTSVLIDSPLVVPSSWNLRGPKDSPV